MKLANFNSISPDIIWTPRNDNHSSSYIWQQIKKNFLSDLRLLVPPAIAILSIGYVSSQIVSTNMNTKRYSQDHEEYEQNIQVLSIKETNNNKMKTRIENTRSSLVNSIHPYVFSKELQTIIPESVQLKRYEINKNKFYIEAKSNNQKSIDEFIVFINDHSSVEPKSISIEEIITQTNNEANQQQIEDIRRQSKGTKKSYEVKMSANFRILNEEMLKKKSTEFGDFYLLKKLSIFTASQP